MKLLKRMTTKLSCIVKYCIPTQIVIDNPQTGRSDSHKLCKTNNQFSKRITHSFKENKNEYDNYCMCTLEGIIELVRRTRCAKKAYLGILVGESILPSVCGRRFRKIDDEFPEFHFACSLLLIQLGSHFYITINLLFTLSKRHVGHSTSFGRSFKRLTCLEIALMGAIVQAS